MCLRGVLTPCECDLLYYPSLIRAHPSTRAAACGCGHSRCYTNGAKAAPKRSRRSSPLGPATGARLLLDDDLNLDVCIGRHWRNHAVLLDEWALALLLARQRRRRRCGRLSPLPKALLAIDTDLDRGRREHQHSNTSIRHLAPLCLLQECSSTSEGKSLHQLSRSRALRPE